MASLLDQLKTFTTVVVDTGDFASELISSPFVVLYYLLVFSRY